MLRPIPWDRSKVYGRKFEWLIIHPSLQRTDSALQFGKLCASFFVHHIAPSAKTLFGIRFARSTVCSAVAGLDL